MTRSRYVTIVDDITERIASGHLSPGAQLPTVRALMREHGVALGTATRAYKELESVGLVVGEPGRGTFVRDTSLPRNMGLQQYPSRAGVFDLTFNYPSLPGQTEMLREALRSLASSGDLDALLHSAPQGGRHHERQMAARHLRNRGIRVPGEQVMIVNGAQHGLAVSVLALLKPGDVLAVDALTYTGMKALAHAHRLELCAIPQIDGCTDLDALAALCKRRTVRAVYTMPTLHNPLGSVMPLDDRKRLVELADRHDFILIEDGAYAFLADPAPVPLFTLAPHRTVYVSGLSKSVASGLRIGFVAAPLSMMTALEQAVGVSTWNTSSIAVALACRWIDSGVVDDLENRKRRDARSRQKVARRILRDCAITAHPSSFFLWLTLPDGLRADRVVADLKADGVLVTTAEPFAATTHVPQALRVAVGSVSMDSMELALKKIRDAVSF